MKANVIFPRYTRFFACVFPVLLSACATSQQFLVGTLETSGQNVWLNGKRASTEMEIYSGDEVSTGPGSKAYVHFSSGGFIHIDENTDPLFNWLEAGTCLLCKILFGQTFISADKACVQSRHLRAVMGSQINIKVTHDTTTLTVVEGEARLEGPEPLVVRSNEQVTVGASQSDVKPRRLSKEELVAAIKWHTPGIKVAPAPPEPSEMVRLDDVFFNFDDDTVRSDQESQLEEIVKLLTSHPTMRILIEGHSDQRGPVDYNRELGLRRAKAVEDFLVKQGIAAGRIETISRGEEDPLSSCPEETCWAQNRRAHSTIIPK